MTKKPEWTDPSGFVKDTMVMCRQADGLHHEAVITEIAEVDGVRYFSVHYPDCEQLHDETIPEADARYRLEVGNAKNVKHFKKIRNEVMAMSIRKSSIGTPSGAGAPKFSHAITPGDKPAFKQEETKTASPPVKKGIRPVDVSKLVKGTKVMCYYLDRLYYKAEIMDINDVDGVRHFSIHYPRWGNTYDETIAEAEARYRLVEHSDEIAEHFKKVCKAKKAVQKGKSAASTPSALAASERSRVGTPAEKKTPRAAKRPSTTAIDTPVAKLPQPGTSHGTDQNYEVPTFTVPLKYLLEKDEELVARRNKLVKVPARHPVNMIIDEYIATIGKPDEQMDTARELYSHGMTLPDATAEDQKQYAESLLAYFDASIGSQSLYAVESPQFVTLYEQEVAKLAPESNHNADNGSRQSTTIRLSGQYGVIHLLRMLVQFGKILSFTPFVEPEGLMKQAQDLLLFLHTRHLEYHVEKLDYVDATEEYLQNVPDAREKKLRILGAKK